MNLNQLIKKVDRAFGITKKTYTRTFVYHLGTIYGGWRFTVVDSWHKWFKHNYQHEFQAETPEACIRLFLLYIKENKISPKELME